MDLSLFYNKVQHLPDSIQKQLLDYLDFLLSKQVKESKPKQKFSFDWENGLKDLKNKFSSVDLQHHINNLR